MAATRDDIRSGIFASQFSKPRTKQIAFFGQTVELRQPDLGTILGLGASADEEKPDRKRRMVDMIIAYTFVPGTENRIFDECDVDGLLSLPWGPDFSRMNAAIKELTDIDMMADTATKNSEDTLSSST